MFLVSNEKYGTLSIYVPESWDRANPLACLIWLSILVDKVQSSILNFFLPDLKLPENKVLISYFKKLKKLIASLVSNIGRQHY